MIEHRLYNESNLATMARMADNSVDAIVTDPPYGLGSPPPIVDVLTAWLAGEVYHPGGRGFMGKEWDAFVPGPEIWRECLRVLKPGGHLISFFGTRTYHLGTLAIQLAGFEVRDQLAWIYSVGMPHGQDISKAIDKVPKAKVIDFAAALKSRRIELGLTISAADNLITGGTTMYSFLEGRTVDGVLTVYPPTVSYYLKIVECFGLKGWDDIVENNLDIVGAQAGNYGYQLDGKRWVRMRTLTAPSSPLAKQYDGWNTNLKPAQENIVLARKPLIGTVAANVMEYGTGGLNIDGCRIGDEERTYKGSGAQKSKLNNHGTGDTGIGYADGSSKNKEYTGIGRYPANVLHDGSPEVLTHFPSAPGQLSPSRTTAGEKTNAIYGKMNHNSEQMMPRQDESKSAARFFYCAKSSGSERGDFNDHPTVKPVSLMRWLVRLITPPGGVVYDPFAGSGSTLIAAFQEGFECIGSELDAHYCDIYEKRKLMFPRTQSLL